MRFATLSTPTYSTPRMAGLQAQASTANVAQAQQTEAFTPSGRLQRQGFKNEAQVMLAINAIRDQLKKLGNLATLEQIFPGHQNKLETQLETLLGQLSSREYTGKGAYLVGLNFEGADFRGADFRGANLQKAILDRAQLQEAILDRAQLQGANLRSAQMRGAQLRWANLRWAYFRGAQLQEVQFQGAIFNGADFEGADLEDACGLPLGITSEQLQGAINSQSLQRFTDKSGQSERSRG
jgi:uncharacterized protein YjbI with pentapeptide repeats